jgi:hypothetical protein
MTTYEGVLPCDTVTFYEVKRRREIRPGFLRPVTDKHVEVARVEIGEDLYVHFTPDRSMYLQAVAWNGDEPKYVFRAALVGAHTEYRVGPFPLLFTASNT